MNTAEIRHYGYFLFTLAWTADAVVKVTHHVKDKTRDLVYILRPFASLLAFSLFSTSANKNLILTC